MFFQYRSSRNSPASIYGTPHFAIVPRLKPGYGQMDRQARLSHARWHGCVVGNCKPGEGDRTNKLSFVRCWKSAPNKYLCVFCQWARVIMLAACGWCYRRGSRLTVTRREDNWEHEWTGGDSPAPCQTRNWRHLHRNMAVISFPWDTQTMLRILIVHNPM